ncbi:MAG: polysaccharide biosynthesis tyrosine autokinase [Candidatus Contendobacter sp.]|nr:polysaccharide biosynthesis tyrosine autokinase [Candidatus Contendobacter sp.]
MITPELAKPANPEPRPPGQSLAEHPASVLTPVSAIQSPVIEEEPEGDGLNLRELWQVLVKRRWTIIILALIVVIAVVTATFLMTPIYRANLTLQIDREDIKILTTGEVAPEERWWGSQDYFQTQYELLKSRSLALRVVNQLGMADLPPPSPSPLAKFKTWLVGWLPKTSEAKDPEKPVSESDRLEGVVSGFLGGLTVEPVHNSRLVKLYYDSPNPQQAAAILNTLVKNFINVNMERRFEASTYARNFLQERLQQVKAKLEESEREMITFARQQQIISVGPDNNQTIVSQNLATTVVALAEAEKKRFDAEAVYRQMLATRGQGLSQVLNSTTIQTLKESKAKLEIQYQDNLNIYKPAYPAMVQLRNQISQLDALINQEIGNIRAAITAEYEAAKAIESLLRNQLEQSKQDLLALQDRSIRLNILRREVDTNRQLYDGLLQRFKEVGVAAGVGTNNISVVDEAKVPRWPYKPNLRLNALLALVLGLLGGIGLAFLFEHLDDTFRRPEELEKLLGLPVLGVIPKSPPTRGETRSIALVGHDDPRSVFAEAYRSVRTALQFSTASGVPRLLTVTSAMSGEGKTTTALSLAIQFAQAGKRTLLIEADLRKPSLHRALNLDNQVGLTNYLAGGGAQPVDIAKPTHIPNLFAVPSGPLPPNPAELLSSARMVELLSLAAGKFDQVILDSPPLLGLADALIIGHLCEGTLLTVEMGVTPRGYAQGALKRLRGGRVHVLGAILTKLEARAGAYGYYRSYYYYYHTGYYGEAAAPDAKKLPV